MPEWWRTAFGIAGPVSTNAAPNTIRGDFRDERTRRHNMDISGDDRI
jgi:hypothetical protein